MNRANASVVLPLLLLPLAVCAQVPAAPWYLSLDSGAAVVPDSSVDYGSSAAPSRALKFQTGWGVAGVTGWEVHPSLRLEVQLGYMQNSVRAISPGVLPSGSVSATTTMLVGRWQCPTGIRVHPFVALGVGRAWVAQNLTVDGENLSGSSSASWAYQASVGAFIPLTQRLDLDLSYRYLSTQPGIFLSNNFFLYHSRFESHATFAGLTWRVR